ncbi:MAG: MobA/MobL family protein [Gammaproteobacteria bacterium]|nr:MobA/MobL family protein [Gammaproteobacteria bacterium]
MLFTYIPYYNRLFTHFDTLSLIMKESANEILQHCILNNKEEQKNSVIHVAAMHSASDLFDICNQRLSSFALTPKKRYFIYCNILLPSSAPGWFKDRSMLWNNLEQITHNSLTQMAIAHEIKLSYPQGLTEQSMITLAEEFVTKNICGHNFIADTYVHLSKPDNPHMHILIPLLPFWKNGFKLEPSTSLSSSKLKEYENTWKILLNAQV